MSEALQTIGDILAAHGYGYRPCQVAGLREVYHIESGEVVGDFHACDAYAWLMEQIKQTKDGGNEQNRTDRP